MENLLIDSFETTQCFVNVMDTNYTYNNEKIYCITSVHKADGKILVRFGNAAQIASIKGTYHILSELELQRNKI